MALREAAAMEVNQSDRLGSVPIAPVTAAGLPDLQAFLYGENAVRAVEKNGEVWFDHPPLR